MMATLVDVEDNWEMNDEFIVSLIPIVTACFFATWIILPVVAFFVFRRMDVRAKRQWQPRFVILTGCLFLFFSTTLAALISRSLEAQLILLVSGPMVALISYLNIKFTKFCGSCGATIYNHNWFTPMRFCSKCGASLEANEGASDAA